MELVSNSQSVSQHPQKGDGGPKALEVTDAQSVEAGHLTETKFSRLSVWVTLSFMSIAVASDSYNASVIGSVSLLFDVIYPDAMTSSMYSRLSNSFLIGMILGMILFGFIADHYGRKTGAIATTIILTVGMILSTAASGTSHTGLLWMLVVGRGVTGVGAGGEYPVTGAGAMEATDEASGFRKRRGFIFAIMSEVAASLGYCFGGLVPMILLLCVHEKQEKYELVWRLSFAAGMLPPLSIFYFRLKMAVSTAYRKSALQRQRQPYLLIVKKYWRRLMAGGWTWFIYNWISIPFGVFSSTIVSRVDPGNSLVASLGWGVLINSFYLPGPFLGGWLADKVGRKQTMTLGFLLQAILGFILGGAYQSIINTFPLFIVMYGIFLTLGEVGPGSTIALVSAEPFPTSIRGQANGIISAWAKVGATLGTQVFTAVLNRYTDDVDKGNRVVFLIGSGFAVVGAAAAWFMLEETSRNLDDEDEVWKAYLRDNNWSGDWGDNETVDPARVLK
ncbi:major facilitator superfamily transporter [Fusarium mundagurra]|uniref:Major facilitator superfamily transporter n=1 Tax=Fusarium mundagurra TaxID=1567541 RepID=A0A8H5Z9D7_9HYPO|nr:major facilitator superfamily transporter [Fusarium mundagurra]